MMLIDVSEMTQKAAFDLVTVGHFALDTILSPTITQPRTTLGGPPTYVSVAAAKLGARVSVVSKVGVDFPSKFVRWLQKNNVDLSGLIWVSKASSTRFVLEYKGWRRRLKLEARAPSILSRDVLNSLSAKIVHVAPIASEVPRQTMLKLRRSIKVMSLDPQGLMRSFDREGNVSLKRWTDTEVLSQVEIFKSAEEETRVMTGKSSLRLAVKDIADHGVKIVLVTKGLKGSVLYSENTFHDIPAYELRDIADPTGAGDSFIGAFLAEYLRSKDTVWCSCVGSAAASFVVEGTGPERFGESHEVYERAHTIYEKVTGRNNRSR